MIEPNKLLRELLAAGIQTSGCNSSGKVWALDGVTEIQNQPAVAAIIAAHDPIDYEAIDRDNLIVSAEAAIKAIPAWKNYTEPQALSWIDTNIGIPLAEGRAQLPAANAMTGAAIRQAFLAILNILDKMLIFIIAATRLLVAIRDRNGKRYNNGS